MNLYNEWDKYQINYTVKFKDCEQEYITYHIDKPGDSINDIDNTTILEIRRQALEVGWIKWGGDKDGYSEIEYSRKFRINLRMKVSLYKEHKLKTLLIRCL